MVPLVSTLLTDSRSLEGPPPETEAGLSSFRVEGGELAAGNKSASDENARGSGRSVLSAAWVELLGRYDWAWFATFTFRDEVHPEAASKRFRVWASQLAGSYLGRNWRRKRERAPQWVRGLEWQRRHVLHYHALVTNLPREYVDELHRSLWARMWFELGNTGFARIDPCNCRDEVYEYLSKYVTKGGEIDFSPTLRLAAARLALA
jgi:hypothetical protein